VLAEIAEANAEVSAGRVEAGVLKVVLPASFGHQHVAPLIPRFATLYKRRLALSLSDRKVNVMAEGFDVGVCIAELDDSSLTARRLAPNRRVACASPGYLAAHRTLARRKTFLSATCLITSESTSNRAPPAMHPKPRIRARART